ncbi:MAG: formate dehydrogenase subunit delta [Gammaproteobacteria bacterium]|nr:formate dehydrogenase subunit delta [Gammaproteobacteria bacterium]
MTVKIEKLLKMAEQITANMAFTGDQEVVAAKVADHLNRFWDPRMKAAIKAYGEQSPEQLSPPLQAALVQLN